MNGSEPSLALTFHLVAIGLTRVDRDLYAAIALTAVVGVVGGNRLALAFAGGLQSTRGNAKRLQIRTGGQGATLREVEIVGIGSDTVGVADDQDIGVWILVETRSELFEIVLS